MKLYLFNCFRKLFEMINEDACCLTRHKASEIPRLYNIE